MRSARRTAWLPDEEEEPAMTDPDKPPRPRDEALREELDALHEQEREGHSTPKKQRRAELPGRRTSPNRTVGLAGHARPRAQGSPCRSRIPSAFAIGSSRRRWPARPGWPEPAMESHSEFDAGSVSPGRSDILGAGLGDGVAWPQVGAGAVVVEDAQDLRGFLPHPERVRAPSWRTRPPPACPGRGWSARRAAARWCRTGR